MTPLPPTLPSSSNPCLPIFFVVLGTPSSYTLHSRGFINLSALVSLLSLAPIDVLTSILSLNLSEPGISQNLAFPFFMIILNLGYLTVNTYLGKFR